MAYQQRKKFLHDTRYYFWEELFLFKWGVDQMIRRCAAESPFPPSYGNRYILMVVDYVSKWVEAEAYLTNDAKTPRAIIRYNGSHFVNKWLKWLLDKYDVKHKVAMAYHLCLNGQVELANK
ncbi:retroelement pol polyprotein-like [Gossypium australe]|uniref:Retroelement pol polyprotein-like n=1 Tax=Gossypium australe TaxID=47621 RepID=A0A5B6V9M0_9ROSI|nr:retroelement pol polyprotein-like [Gossypium australe]